MACLVVALGELHANSIIYRDIKLENIMIGDDGYPVLTDFGMSRKLVEEHTNSFGGTLHYMAPEVIKKDNYKFEVDWWGIGALTYDMVYGIPPFYAKTREEIIHNIHNKKLSMKSSTSVSEDCKKFILALLERRPSKRLGTIGGVREIMSHPFFKSINFDDIVNKTRKPDFVPEV